MREGVYRSSLEGGGWHRKQGNPGWGIVSFWDPRTVPKRKDKGALGHCTWEWKLGLLSSSRLAKGASK